MSEKIEPCPFCGEKLVEKSDHHGSWWAHREEPGPCFDSTAQLMDESDIERWNRRSSASSEIAALREELAEQKEVVRAVRDHATRVIRARQEAEAERASLAARVKEVERSRDLAHKQMDADAEVIIGLDKKLDALSAWAAEAKGALEEADRLERKCSDAWCGGDGDADLIDLGMIGKIVRRLLATFPTGTEKEKPELTADWLTVDGRCACCGTGDLHKHWCRFGPQEPVTAKPKCDECGGVPGKDYEPKCPKCASPDDAKKEAK